MTWGGSGHAADDLGRLESVETRHPDVHEYDVRDQPAYGVDTVLAVDGLAHHLDVRGAAEDHHQTRTDQPVVVDDQDPDGVHVVHGNHPASSNDPPSVRVVTRPPASLARSPSPTRPRPVPGVGPPGATTRGPRRVAHADAEAVVRRAGHLQHDRHPRGVLAHVGQPLLDDPVRRPAHLVRHRGGPGHPVDVLDPHPGSLGLPDERRQVPEGRLRAFVRAAGSAVAKHAEDLPEVVDRLVRGRLDQLRGLLLLRVAEVGAVGQRPGMDGDQADPVGQHVVHLAGDPGPLVELSLFHPEPLLGLRALGPVTQGPQQFAPRADVHAAGQHGDRGEHAQDEIDPQRPIGAGLDQRDRHRGDQVQHSDQQDLPGHPAGGERHLGERAGAVGGRPRRAHDAGQHRDAQRPAPPEEGRRQGREAERQVEPEEPPGLVPLSGCRRRPQDQAERHHRGRPPQVPAPGQRGVVLIRARALHLPHHTEPGSSWAEPSGDRDPLLWMRMLPARR